jgi:tRNA (mo5U34)-methyltransferase
MASGGDVREEAGVAGSEVLVAEGAAPSDGHEQSTLACTPTETPDALGTLADRVAALSWYHRMDLGGVVTPGVSDTRRGLPRLKLPHTLAGKSVLDVGAWDGFYSFEAARRGARQVLATDSFAWDGSCWGSKDGFLLARSVLGLDHLVEDRLIDVMDLSPARLNGIFDVTLFLGVLYHLKDPFTALERVAAVTGELLVLETETGLNLLPSPACRVYAGRELNHDDGNFFAFNQSALKKLLRVHGFSRVEVKYRSSVRRRLARTAVGMTKHQAFRPTFCSARIVLHAWR